MMTPGTGTVFGIWGATPDDMWAVGGDSDATGGFAWRLRSDAWVPEPLACPPTSPTNAAIWKMYGTSANDAWLVGSNGVALHWDGARSRPATPASAPRCSPCTRATALYAAVGGTATGIIVEYDGSRRRGTTSPPSHAPMGLSGVTLGADGFGIAVGSFGARV